MGVYKERRMDKFFAYLGGVQGSGKGTISDMVTREHADVSAFHFSRLLLAHLGAHSLDDFDALESNECNSIRASLYKSKLFDLKTAFGLIDSHYVKIIKGGSIRVCLNQDSAQSIGLFLHLVSDPEVIAKRIKSLQGAERERRIAKYSSFDEDLLSGIGRLQQISISTAQSIADQMGKPFVKIENNFTPEEVAKRVYLAIRENL